MSAVPLLCMALIGFVSGYMYSSLRTQHDANAILRGTMPRHPSLKRVFTALAKPRGQQP